MAANVRALRSAGHLENASPELKPTEDTKAENIFYCSSVFGQPNMPLIVALRSGFIRRPPLTQNLECCAFVYCVRIICFH
jgi:hypothetical protein